jgi:DNA helicase-2/ATP-dependent DNA helicase PcrA
MRQRSRYDFDDMINWVIEAFGENEALLRRYQEQYQYILVDEYQDTSGAQNKIVNC